ncbi:MAG: extracellular solute-binding protein [Oscillospiraceae bacterium]|nr:extracellular solute-binding protein [Oscillospiraceae bacterium]
MYRNKIMIKALSVFLSSVLFFGGCAVHNETPEEQAAMGRFVEDVIPFPEGLESPYYLGMDDERLKLVGWAGEISLWTHSGETDSDWEKQDVPFIKALDNLEIEHVASFDFGADGTPYCLYRAVSSNPDQWGEHVLAAYRQGAWQAIEIDLYPESLNINGSAEDFRVTEDGGFLVSYYYLILSFDSNGAYTGQYRVDTRMSKGFFMNDGGVMSVFNKGRIERYDFGGGAQLADIAIQQGTADRDFNFMSGSPPQTAIAKDAASGDLCYANKSGVYQLINDGQLMEKLVDGALTSFVKPTMSVRQIIPGGNGDIFLCGRDEVSYRSHLFRYRYDGSVPTVPGTQLAVHSLYDSPTIRQAMGDFQRDNPDVVIKYTVSISGDDGVTLADAQRTLSTEILAGKGPDLLLLDGLPVYDYIDKGILSPVGDLPGNLHPAISGTFSSGGEIYAVPVHYTIPLLLAAEGVAASVQTPAALASHLSQQQNPRIGLDAVNYPMFDLQRVYWHRWFEADGRVNAENMKEDLQAIGEIDALLKDIPHPDGGTMGADFITNSLLYSHGGIGLYIGALYSIENLGGPFTAQIEHGAALSVYPAGHNGYIPTDIAGILSSSSRQELAREFLLYMLNTTQQTYDVGEGIPVNMDAVDAILASREYDPDDGFWSFGMTAVDPETGEAVSFIDDIHWPDKAYQDAFVAMIKGLSAPIVIDLLQEQIVIEEATGYFEGRQTLQDAVNAITEKVGLMLKE